jgi:hypothetical protein
MTPSREPLIQLATATHDPLSRSELALLEQAATGHRAAGDDPPEPPHALSNIDGWALIEKWGEDRVVRASVLRWLLTDQKVQEFFRSHDLLVRSCIVSGSLVCSDHDLRSPHSFHDCVFTSEIQFSRCTVPALSFFQCRFPQLNCKVSTVRGDFTIHSCHADWGLDISGAEIGGSLSCFSSVGMVVVGDGANIKGDLTLQEIEYSPDDRLSLTLQKVQVNGHVRISKFRNLGLVRLDGGTFSGKVEITDVVFGTRDYPSGLVASAATVSGELLWAPNGVNDRTLLHLDRARVGSFGDSVHGWVRASNMDVNGFRYSRLLKLSRVSEHVMREEEDTDVHGRLAWLAIQPLWNLTRQPYEQFAMWLRTKGREREAIDVLIAGERRLRLSTKKARSSRLWSWVLEWTVGYGYRPLRSLLFIAGEVLIGAVVFGIGFDHGALALAKKEDGLQPAFNALVYSLDVFLPVIDFRQAEYWIATGRGGLGKAMQWFTWFHIAAGWILSTLAVAGFSGLVKGGSRSPGVSRE